MIELLRGRKDLPVISEEEAQDRTRQFVNEHTILGVYPADTEEKDGL